LNTAKLRQGGQHRRPDHAPKIEAMPPKTTMVTSSIECRNATCPA